MKIGNSEINGYAALAPMAGVADRAMREICEKYGAAYSVGELTSAKAITLGDKKSRVFWKRVRREFSEVSFSETNPKLWVRPPASPRNMPPIL